MSISIKPAPPAVETSKTSSSKAPEIGQVKTSTDNRLNAADVFVSSKQLAQERSAETANETEADAAKTDYEKQGQSRIDNIYKQMELASKSKIATIDEPSEEYAADEEYAGEQVSIYAVDDSVA